jgi:hypothetical protein
MSGNGDFPSCGHMGAGGSTYLNIPTQPYQGYGPDFCYSQQFLPNQYQPSPNYGMPSYGYNMETPYGYGMNHASADTPMLQAYGFLGGPNTSWYGPIHYAPSMQDGTYGLSPGQPVGVSEFRVQLAFNWLFKQMRQDLLIHTQQSQNQGQQIPIGAVIEATAQRSIPNAETRNTDQQAVPHPANLDNGQHAIPAAAISATNVAEAVTSGSIQPNVWANVKHEDASLDEIVWSVCGNYYGATTISAPSEVRTTSQPIPSGVTVGRSWASSPTAATESVGWRSKKGLSVYTRRAQEEHNCER